MNLFKDDPSVYHVMNRDSPKKRCTLKKKDGSRCQNKTTFIDKHFKPACGVHLNKYDRMVCIAEFRLEKGFCLLRETTMRDELKIFSESHQCAVCLNEIKVNSSVLTPCGHFFHQDCLSQWLYKKQNCPLCRTEIQDQAEDQTEDQTEYQTEYQTEDQTEDQTEMAIALFETEDQQAEDLYSVLDVIESPETRRRIREANIHFLIDRIHSYDVAVDLAGFFLTM